VLEVLALWLAPPLLVAPTAIAIGLLIFVLGARKTAPALALGLAGGATVGLVPTLGLVLPTLAVAAFLAVAAVARVSSNRSTPHLAALPVRSRG
ncbi:MAG: hypothetical protein ACRDHY_17370, partial [Anaerolineales bacterium]